MEVTNNFLNWSWCLVVYNFFIESPRRRSCSKEL